MKNLLSVWILLNLSFLSFHVIAQTSVPLAELNVKGRWKAACPTEVVNHASIQNCELCTFEIDSKNKKRATINNFEMCFQKDSVSIIKGGNTISVPYKRNKDTHALTFTLESVKYDFRVFLNDDGYILINSDGLPVVLSKME